MIRAKHVITGNSTRCTHVSYISAVDATSSLIRLEAFVRVAYVELIIDLHLNSSITEGLRGIKEHPYQEKKNDRRRAEHE